jgi:hypothetical protein
VASPQVNYNALTEEVQTEIQGMRVSVHELSGEIRITQLADQQSITVDYATLRKIGAFVDAMNTDHEDHPERVSVADLLTTEEQQALDQFVARLNAGAHL